MSDGEAVELKNDFAWAEDSVLLYTTHGCNVILQGQEMKDGNSCFVILEFSGVQSVRSAATDCSPAFNIEPNNSGVSFVAILNSDWDQEAHDEYTYTGTPKLKDRKHFVITNHDIFHEILGESFEEKLISQADEDYEFVKSLYLFSKAQII